MGVLKIATTPPHHHGKIATQECMDANPLTLADNPSESKYYVPIGTPKTANFSYTVSLPQGLTCSQCVLQWRHFAANNWGESLS